MRKSFPICVVLDLDGTIIGDVDNIVKDYEIRNNLAESLQKPHLKQNKKDLFDRFENGLLRPHFLTFVAFLLQHKENVHAYIYTASSDSWAHYIVPMVEAYVSKRLKRKFKFQRPLFTRSACILDPKSGAYIKSIDRIKPEIDKTMRETHYPIIFVDNNITLRSHERRHMFHCASYEPLIPIDFARKVGPHETNNQAFVRIVHDVICRCNNTSCVNSVEGVMGNYYKLLGNSFSHYAAQKSESLNDDFWLIFTKAFALFIMKYEKSGHSEKYLENTCKILHKFYYRVKKPI